MKINYILIISFFILGLTPSLKANPRATKPQIVWGNVGHRIVGLIAERHLSKKAKKALAQIMGKESLAEASNWADFIRSDSTYKYTAPWHYVSIPDGKTYDEIEKSKDGDVIEAIQRFSNQLKDSKLPKDKQVFAIRFLVHLLGDIHQPYHVGRLDDRGGNNIKVSWFGKETNIHAVWDSEVINGQNLSYTEYADFIDKASKSQIKQWQTESIWVWAKESMQYRDALYAAAKGGEKLSYNYEYQFIKIMEQRMLQAGIRLAGTFNQLFDK